jgi:hypothetical protein
MRLAARVFVVLCALGSLACTLYAGQHNRSMLLVGMFAVWVVAPFAGLFVVLPRWESASSQSATLLHATVIVFCITAFFIYAMNTLHPRGHNAAAPFLLEPLFMWGGIASGFLFVRSRS